MRVVSRSDKPVVGGQLRHWFFIESLLRCRVRRPMCRVRGGDRSRHIANPSQHLNLTARKEADALETIATLSSHQLKAVPYHVWHCSVMILTHVCVCVCTGASSVAGRLRVACLSTAGCEHDQLGRAVRQRITQLLHGLSGLDRHATSLRSQCLCWLICCPTALTQLVWLTLPHGGTMPSRFHSTFDHASTQAMLGVMATFDYEAEKAWLNALTRPVNPDAVTATAGSTTKK